MGQEGERALTHTCGAGGEDRRLCPTRMGRDRGRTDPHSWGGPTLMGEEEKGETDPHLWGGPTLMGGEEKGGTDPHLWGVRGSRD